MSECETTTELQWVLQRFDGHCYFYPARDCPGWAPGSVCSRMSRVIPKDAEPDE